MRPRQVPQNVAAIAALSPFEQIETIRSGIATQVFDQLAAALGVGKEALARKLNINAQTLRKRKSRVLSADEAEKSLRVARIFAFATEVLEGEEDARQWLNDTIPALGGKRPLDLLDTDIGAQQVTNLLGCIKWDLYA
ncbi:MAG: antitoxin Xre/MbcA/ParS toxin-binding domain-containing protein [Chthoniobacterales bacterium]